MKKPSGKITVLIVDDHTVVRQGLKSLLESAGDIEVVGEAKNGDEALRKAKTLQPRVVLLDIAMPVMHGIEAAQRMAETTPASKVLILSSYSDPREVDRAMDAGVAGYMMKETASSEVVQAVREAHRGNAYFSPQISKRLLRNDREAFIRRGTETKKRAAHLTERETQVLELITKGLANKQIADALSLSIKTVEKHRGSLMQKLDIHETASLTRYALSSGVVKGPRPSLMPST